MNSFTLSNGRQIPCVGYGCFNAFGKEIENAVRMALDAGYRYIDSAESYENEADIGPAIRDYPGEREDLFILSKAWPSSFEDIPAAAERSILNLKAEYLDAYLIHWPGTKEDRMLSAYEHILKLQEKGTVLAPGVSNFSIEQMEKIRDEFGAYPVIHELECHPAYQQKEMIAWCARHGIRVIAYRPINRKADMDLPVIGELAAKYGRSPAQIILRWHVQHEHLPIPKSTNPERLRENLALFDFELSREDMDAIDRLETGVRCSQDPKLHPPGF